MPDTVADCAKNKMNPRCGRTRQGCTHILHLTFAVRFCLGRPALRTWRCAAADGDGSEDIAAGQAELRERRAELRERLQSADLNGLTVPELRKCCREAGQMVKGVAPFCSAHGLCSRNPAAGCAIAAVRQGAIHCSKQDLHCTRGSHAMRNASPAATCASTQQLVTLARPGCAAGRRDLRKGELIQKLRSWLSPEGTEEEPLRRAALDLGHLTIPQLKDWLRDRGVSVKGAYPKTLEF